MSSNQKEMVEDLKIQWKRLWQERVDDKVRAEGIATDDYSKLFVEKGTLIHATRDFKALNFKDILEQHLVVNAERFISPRPQIGGWTKFIRSNITNQRSNWKNDQNLRRSSIHKKKQQRLRANGRGWLHL